MRSISGLCDQRLDIGNAFDQHILPVPETSIGVYRINPALGSLALDLLQLVVTLDSPFDGSNLHLLGGKTLV
jgi:hypothetical protein